MCECERVLMWECEGVLGVHKVVCVQCTCLSMCPVPDYTLVPRLYLPPYPVAAPLHGVAARA